MSSEIDVGMKCIKYMLFVANFMFVMIGFLLISIGSTIKAIYGDFELFMEDHYFSPAILAIVIGVVIFFVALFGCVGAIKESTCLINLFGFFLALLLVMEVAAAIAAYAMRSEIKHAVRVKMVDSLPEYYNDGYVQEMWDITQQNLRCCGIDSADDWNSNNPLNATTPSSCCRYRDLTDDQCPAKKVYKDGCVDALTYVVSESALLLGCGALAVAFIQLLGIIFSWMLAKAIRRLKTQQLLDRDQTRQRAYEQMAVGKEQEPIPTPVLYTPTFSEA